MPLDIKPETSRHFDVVGTRPLRPDGIDKVTGRARAKQALKLIEVDYEVLPHVTDVDEAMKPDAPVIHDTIFTEGVEPKPTKPSNVWKQSVFGHGNVEAGFREAEIIVERSFKT